MKTKIKKSFPKSVYVNLLKDFSPQITNFVLIRIPNWGDVKEIKSLQKAQLDESPSIDSANDEEIERLKKMIKTESLKMSKKEAKIKASEEYKRFLNRVFEEMSTKALDWFHKHQAKFPDDWPEDSFDANFEILEAFFNKELDDIQDEAVKQKCLQDDEFKKKFEEHREITSYLDLTEQKIKNKK